MEPTLTLLQAIDRPLECGTTCTLAVLQGDQLLLAHVGDSSAALVRCGSWVLWCPTYCVLSCTACALCALR
jgi:hypothetical protein